MDDFAWVSAALSERIENEGRVLFGALLGAVLITLARGQLILVPRKRLSALSQGLLVLLALGVGYLFEPLLTSLVPSLTPGMAAFVAAVAVIPVCLKLMVWLDAVDMRDILQRWRR
ncbi:hypothetical protein E6B08_20485 [Pseudomonas putida]|uniref:Uncharacterized protein n=1 Tax=Pseudomonas putida TaxID=303 RepID=A0A4D6XHF8_PSEPU|nr:hypothetical protein [Pseudomonas putida]QCI13581.1 hypothetical protein E6B08_20485 [Pseudomonas putida]